VYEREPAWFKPKPQTFEDQKHAKALCEGLKLLVGIIDRAKQARAA
jgi:soluble cytochrome b562